MGDDLASRFAEQQSNEIDWNGPLFSLYDLPSEINELTIRFISAAPELPQGLRLKVRGGSMAVNGITTNDIVLWTDTAPPEVSVNVTWKGKEGRSLRIWNTWRINDVAHAWLGNAAMRVSVSNDGKLLFNCSDGVGEPNFNDLVATVSLR